MNLEKEKHLAGCCGLYCGLCPRFQSKAPSRCLSCHLGEQHSYCSIYRCCVTKRGFFTCADCDEYPCERLLRVLGVEEGLDSFISHKPALSNLDRIREVGLDTYLEEQRERRLLVEQLLANYNEGRSMSFYCAACALMPPDLVRQAIEEMEGMLSSKRVDGSNLKAKAKAMRTTIQNLASQAGINLKLRTIREIDESPHVPHPEQDFERSSMTGWRDALKADPIPWLLEPDNPSVRYWTLRDLLGRPEDDAEVQIARAAVVQSDVVQRLLAAQHPDGYWGDDPRQPYGAARTTAHLVVLAELGVPVNDRIRRGCEYFLEASQQPDGGLSEVTGSSSREWYCINGYMLKALIRLGYDRDPRVAAAWDYLHRRMVQGEGKGLDCPYSNDKGPCQWGFVKVLDAVAAVSPSHRTAEQRELAAQLAESLLAYDWDFGGREKRWLSFGWPYQYQSDLLDTADVLARLGHGADERFGAWVDLILAQQDEQGCWARRAGIKLIDAGKKNRANKWITLKALRMLKAAARLP